MEAMRHAQEHWLRLQAEEALKLAAEVEPDMYFLKGGIEEILPLAALWRKDALDAAAKLLVKAELIHRELVRRGEKV